MNSCARLALWALASATLSAPALGQSGSLDTRPRPRAVRPPPAFRAAIRASTRAETGRPGDAYWQQWTAYQLEARVDPLEKRMEGHAEITYHNRSPHVLPDIYLHLDQNLHAPGAIRNEPQEMTGGVTLDGVAVGGLSLDRGGEPAGYAVDGTIMRISLPRPLAAGDSVLLTIDWHFTVPQSGAGRMGWSRDNFLFLAYWYPQMAVFDDVVGWQIDPYLGSGEFYAGFGRYDLSITVPERWIVRATGVQTNDEDVFPKRILERLFLASASDSVIHVITREEFRNEETTLASDSGTLVWKFRADSVRDVAFSVTLESLWDAARTPVGDRDGDGETDYTRIDALYRVSAPRWRSTVKYAQHALAFLSKYTGLSYPWLHMTAVEGAGIIDGGMEFPMMTLIGSYNQSTDEALYYVTAHELAHMWLPMTVSTDERRYGWMDEGSTTFNENMARTDFFPGVDHTEPDRETYTQFALSGREGEIMRWTDYQYPGAAGVASYSKPASVLVALRRVLGEETFTTAWRRFIADWAFKHPKPWDLFNTFEDVSGRDLHWFWSSWYYETWVLNQGIGSVTSEGGAVTVRVVDRGDVPMPVYLTVTFGDGTTQQREIPVEEWLGGLRETEVTVRGEAPVVRVEIDAEHALPDVDRSDNVWTADD